MATNKQYSRAFVLLLAAALFQGCNSGTEKSGNSVPDDQLNSTAEEANSINELTLNPVAALPGGGNTTPDNLVPDSELFLQLKELLKIASGNYIVEVSRLLEDVLISSDLGQLGYAACNGAGTVALEETHDDLWSGYTAHYSLENCTTDGHVLSGSIHKYHNRSGIGRTLGDFSVTQNEQTVVMFKRPNEFQGAANDENPFDGIRIPTHGKPNLVGVYSRTAENFSISYPDGTFRTISGFENYCNIHDGKGTEFEIEIVRDDHHVLHIARIESRYTITDTLFGGATMQIEVVAENSKTGSLVAINESGSRLEAVFQAENEPAVAITIYQNGEILILHAARDLNLTLNCDFETRFFRHEVF